jgi:hypothetical protein
MGARPRRLIVVTAHYDSPRMSPLRHPEVEPHLRSVHLILVTCMVVVLAGCAAQGVGAESVTFAFLGWLKWVAGLFLAMTGLALIFFDTQSEYTRGASDNASGVAALFAIARELNERPPENTDVWVVATGSHETWMSGMRRLLRAHRPDKRDTLFINLHNVGAGDVCYVQREGVLYPFPSSKTLLALANAQHVVRGVEPIEREGLPTDALLPLIRGFEAITVTTRDERLAREWDIREMDEADAVDYGTVLAAAQFAETLVRRLDYTAPD